MQVLVAVTFFVVMSSVMGGFPNLNCRDPRDPNAKVILDCNVDCIHQHGTVGGQCGNPFMGDYNCYCGAPTTNVYEQSGQCMERSAKIEDLCGLDCVCNHAATGGRCDFERKACVCHGYNMENKRLCPFEKSEQFLNHLYQLMGAEKMSKFTQYSYVKGQFQGMQ